MRSAMEVLGNIIWGTTDSRPGDAGYETERALSAVRGFSNMGLFVVALYGACASPAGHVVSGACVALVAATGAFAVGGFMGLLFGTPRISGGSAAGNGASPPSGAGAARQTAPQAVQQNTSLERVVDWVTTLIVGLGLVNLKEALEYAKRVSVWLTGAIVSPGGPAPVANGSAGAAILVSYAIAGFFLVFLWARRYMPREMRAAEIDEIQNQLELTRAAATKIGEIALTQGSAAATGTPWQGFGDLQALANQGFDPATIEELAKRYAGAHDYNDEPLANFGDAEDTQTHRRLEASLDAVVDNMVWGAVLTVRSTDPAKSLKDKVAFLVHHTLPPIARVVTPTGGVATLTVPTGGTYVAGAIVANEKTRLAFDLSTVPGAPAAFLRA